MFTTAIFRFTVRQTSGITSGAKGSFGGERTGHHAVISIALKIAVTLMLPSLAAAAGYTGNRWWLSPPADDVQGAQLLVTSGDDALSVDFMVHWCRWLPW